MRLPTLAISGTLLASLSLLPASAVTRTKHPAKHITKAKAPAGPRGIDSARTTEIQGALIKNGYLTGEPTGQWDTQTQAALQKLQGDNGWQTKLVPDSRAIIKLGLGPASSPTQSAPVSR